MNDVSKLEDGVVTLYHNENCSKSRATYELVKKRLPENQFELKVIQYLDEPLSVIQLTSLFDKLFSMGHSIDDCVRVHEDRFLELGLTSEDLKDRNRLIQILVDNPILLERPIISFKGRAVIGRPPENIDKLFK